MALNSAALRAHVIDNIGFFNLNYDKHFGQLKSFSVTEYYAEIN